MRVSLSLKVLTIGALLAAGCKEDDPDPGFIDSGTVADSGAGGGADAGKTDAGPTTDSGGGGSTDSGASTDSGSSTVDSGAHDAGASDAGSNVIATSMGSWTVYDNPYGDGGANPATGIQGTAMAVRAGDGGMTVSLMVSGLPAVRMFGSHVHKADCDAGMAGGHFQFMPAPDGGANDPAFANPTNEVWLDFTTTDAGAGMSSATLSWVPPAGAAKAIVVHDHMTGDGGVAGPKLACLPIPF
jgi:Cu-Zn family superoxide dismutase